MNYLKECLAFDIWLETNHLSLGARSLWHALFNINNRCGWKEWFDVANQTLKAKANLSRQSVYEARNILKQNGLIDFKANGTKAPRYKINSIIDIANIEIGSTLQNALQGDVQEALQVPLQEALQVPLQEALQVPLQNAVPLNKQNKTKQNKTKIKEKNKKKKITQDEIEDVINHLNKKTGAKYNANASSHKEIIIARSNEGYSVDDLKSVIDNQCSKWLEDERMAQYLRPSTLFKKAKFDEYLNGRTVSVKSEAKKDVPSYDLEAYENSSIFD